MPEAQPPRHVGRPDQVAVEQHVERVQRRVAGLLGDDDREVELERLPDQRARLEQPARGRRQAVELDRERRDHRGRHREVVRSRPAARPGLGVAGARELLQVERVAAAHDAEPVRPRGVGPARQQRHGVGLGQRAELDALDDAAPLGGLERRGQPPAPLPLAARERDDEAARRRPPQHVREHLDRRLVGPVQVVEHQQQPAPGRQPLEQAGDGPVRAEPPRAVRPPLERREDGAEIRRRLAGDAREARRVEAGEVLVERVDQDPERQVDLVLGGAALEHEHLALVGAPAQLVEQAGLADAGLAGELEERPLRKRVECSL